MTTILTVGDNSGRRRRCDATCHDAIEAVCRCICNGRYHGKGASAAGMIAIDLLGPDAAGRVLGDDWQQRLGVSTEAIPVDVQQSLPIDVERQPRSKRARRSPRPARAKGDAQAQLAI